MRTWNNSSCRKTIFKRHMWRMPGTIHSVEKQSSSGNTLCAWNNSSCMKNDPQMEYLCAPWNNSSWRKTIPKWKYVACLKQQLNSSRTTAQPWKKTCKIELEYFWAPETIHRLEKRSCSGNTWCLPGTFHRVEKRSSLSQAQYVEHAWYNSSCRKTIKWKYVVHAWKN